MSDLQHKSITLKALNEGSLEAVISTFNQKDRDGDVMLAAAFSRSQGKSIPMVWSHDWSRPIGKGAVQVTPSEAIFAGQFFMDTQSGQEAYKTVKAMGDLQEYSIGFRIIDASDEKTAEGWVRTIRDIELFEASPVLVGAALGTHTIGVKAHKHDEHGVVTFESAAEIHTALKLMQESHSRLCEDEGCEFKRKTHRKDADRLSELARFIASAKGEE